MPPMSRSALRRLNTAPAGSLSSRAALAASGPRPVSLSFSEEPAATLTGQKLSVYLENALVAEITDLSSAHLNPSQRSVIAAAVRKNIKLELQMVFEGTMDAQQAGHAVELLRIHSDKVVSALARLGRLERLRQREKADDAEVVKRSIMDGSYEGVGAVGVNKFIELYLEVVWNDASAAELRSWRIGAEFCFDHLSYTARGKNKGSGCLSGEADEIKILKGITGVYSPGKITLVLGPPGAGKSTLFHCLSGRLTTNKSKGTEVSGDLLINEYRLDELHTPNFVTMVEQIDTHLPMLTTKETLKFAFDCRRTSMKETMEVAPFLSEMMDVDSYAKQRGNTVDLVIAMLGLTGCADTVIGDATVKGVSGGEKKRVTLGEMLVTGGKCLLLDEISTGLDSAATMDITNSLKQLARLMNLTIAVSLLQPPPETFDLFDDVQLMDGGQCVYHGPRTEIMGYFEGLGFRCPAHKDPADFLQEVTTPDNAKYILPDAELAELGITPPRSIDEFAARFAETEWAKAMRATIERHKAHKGRVDPSLKGSIGTTTSRNLSVNTAPRTEIDVTVLRGKYMRSGARLFSVVAKRQFQVLVRNKTFLKGHTAQMIISGLMFGALYFKQPIDVTGGLTKVSLLYLVTLQIALATFQLINAIMQGRAVYYKQKGENFFPPWTYIVGDILAFVPIPVLDIASFATMVYFMSSVAYDFTTYAIFCLGIFTFTLFFGVFLRTLCYALPNENAATGVTIGLLILMVLTNGFFVNPRLVEDSWLSWFYWVNPMSWIIRTLAQNELFSPQYREPCDGSGDQPCGEVVLEFLSMSTDQSFLWSGIGFCAGCIVLFFSTASYALAYVMHDSTNAGKTEKEGERSAKDSATIVAGLLGASPVIGSGTITQPLVSSAAYGGDALAHAMDNLAADYNDDEDGVDYFIPATLAWRDLFYTITLDSNEGKVDVDILKGIRGFARPGELTALMGSSGAGKTTLLDVLAGRKTTGSIKGDIMVNGFKKNDESFKLMVGYVEQFATLPHSETVLEALRFSATLRYRGANKEGGIDHVVRNAVRMLELGPILTQRIGDLETGGLSFEQMKRVSIGVELVANPSILFCDEPTSGLDARAAMFVIGGLKNIAESGRTVICTIHQPSISIFENFEQLLLMKRGGEVVYFGALGERSVDLVTYFEDIPGCSKLPVQYNPATWMLDLIGAGVEAGQKRGPGQLNASEFVTRYNESELGVSNAEMCSALCLPFEGAVAPDHDAPRFRASFSTQFLTLYRRATRELIRTPSYTMTRFAMAGFIPLCLASMMPQLQVETQADLQTLSLAISFIAQIMAIYNYFTCVGFMYKHDPVFYREKGSGMYDPRAWVLAMTIADLPFVVLEVLESGCILYFIVGLQLTAFPFFYFLYLNIAFILFFQWLGALLSAIAPDPASALAIGSIPLNILGAFAGLFPQPSQIPTWLIWAYYISPHHYLNEGLFATQFTSDGSKFGQQVILAVTNEGGAVAMTGAQYYFGNQAPASLAIENPAGIPSDRFAADIIFCAGNTTGTVCENGFISPGVPKPITLEAAGWTSGLYGGDMGYQADWYWIDLSIITGFAFLVLFTHLYVITHFTHEKR